MKYIAKGLVEQGSTEHILKIQRGGHTFQLTGIQAGLCSTAGSALQSRGE